MTRKRILYNAFTHFTLSHQSHGQWRRPDAAAQLAFNSYDLWVRLAKICERGKLDAVFFADTCGVYDTYGGGWDTVARSGMQFPSNDPASLISALGLVTEHLGLVVTSSVLQDHPFSFARKMSTLDHLTKGRVGWNIVTSYLDNAARNYGLDRLDRHDDRYAWAEEYAEVTFKLWEASWQDDAVLADPARGIWADPARIRQIDHVGPRYRVEGPHLVQPSPQRTPVLFQAGTSTTGRAFAAQNAEVTFLAAITPAAAAADIARINALLPGFGRQPGDVKFLTQIQPILGSTEAEARRNWQDFVDRRDIDAYLAHASGGIGFDLSKIDPETPIGDLTSEYGQSMITAVIEAEPDKTATFGDVIFRRLNKAFPVTPEGLADRIEAWVEAGIDGFNLIPEILPDWYDIFVDEAVPILRKRGLIQSDYAPGTLREKIFGEAPHLPDRHRARRLRPWAEGAPA